MNCMHEPSLYVHAAWLMPAAVAPARLAANPNPAVSFKTAHSMTSHGYREGVPRTLVTTEVRL